MFTLIFIIAYCLLYLGLVPFFPRFFSGAKGESRRPEFRSLALIIIATFVIFFLNTRIQDPLLENRFQHALGGGFLGFFTYFLAWRSSGVALNRFQFFFFGLLIVTALGVGNEILEYFLQTYTSLHFASTINDTWLDLVSNLIGILAAAAVFLPFSRRP